MNPDRIMDLKHFYRILAQLEQQSGGKRNLSSCDGRSGWPTRGVYFFFEQGETCLDSGTGLRVVRVGTHALKSGANTTLWNRLRQHKGTISLRGNHRGSVFRLLIGCALAARDPRLAVPTWSIKPVRENERLAERGLEEEVSRYIGQMPFLWVRVEDQPSPLSRRAYIERNSIALLSNALIPNPDAPSPAWLGKQCPHLDICRSGLWNSRHVDDESYDPAFLRELEEYVRH